MKKIKVLTGITTSGTPHLGNYVGAIRPAIAASHTDNVDSFYFMADLHSLIKCDDPKRVDQSTFEIAATWLACNLNPDKVTFYRQSDVPEISELCWILTCVTAKGLMNRAHAYKAQVQSNIANDTGDPDKGITMGLFSYPILMAADILMFNAHRVPVGKDQIQHLEMARDIAGRFNHHYGKHFVLPEAVVSEETAVLKGLDGRKMSKSYDNTIPLFVPEKKLRKLIMKIKTNSLEPGEPKDPEECALFQIFAAFASKEEIAAKHNQYAEGAGWGVLKQELFEFLNEHLKDYRNQYERLMQDINYVQEVLQKGAEKARSVAQPLLNEVKRAVGIRPLLKV
ncbi:MAG: tryptophan--tRNA ligase [Endozoicomonadaceae bacterium]|nr:tryptophan--tRNA ligase [Endozoicomonadaceae bacterium]